MLQFTWRISGCSCESRSACRWLSFCDLLKSIYPLFMFAQLEFHPHKSSTVKHDWHKRNDRRKGRENVLLWRHFRLEENSLWDKKTLLDCFQRSIRLDVLQITCLRNLPSTQSKWFFFSRPKVTSPACVAYVGVKESSPWAKTLKIGRSVSLRGTKAIIHFWNLQFL